MAQATIRVKMDFSFEIMHEAEDEDQLVDFVIASKEFREKVMQRAQEEFAIEAAFYELPEPPDDDDIDFDAHKEADADN